MRYLVVIFAIFIVLFSLHHAQARIIHVPADSSTIQAGINGAVNGDTVLVAPGTYYEYLGITSKTIVLASEFMFTGDTNTIHSTVIDGGGVDVISLNSGGNVVLGFTLTNGHWGIVCDYNGSSTLSHNYIFHNGGPSWAGGGIYIYGGDSQILGNTISGNLGSYVGGIYGNGCYLLIKENVVSNNQSERGGGVFLRNSSGTIEANLVTNNIAVNGAAIYCSTSSGVSILNNTISHNTGVFAGGIYCANYVDQGVTIRNNIISNSVDGFGIYYHSLGGKATNPLLLMSYNDVWGNADGEYGGSCPNQTGFNGNISADPIFCDWQNGNYYLFNTSPCVGAGEGGSNIGAFGVGCGSNYGVLVSSGPDTVTTVNTQIQIGFAVQNIGLVQDNYDVHISDSLGWTLDPTYLQISLNPEQSDSLVVNVSIPATLNYTKNTINLSATSQSQPSTSDSDDLIITALSLCGDANGDGVVDIGDVVYTINYLFKGGPPPCE